MNSAAAIAPATVPFCPACGHNLEAERPVTIGVLTVDPRAAARWRGKQIPLTCAQFLIFASIVQARGKLVSNDVLAERAGYDALGDSHNVVSVLVCRIRRALRAVGAPPTIVRVQRGRGYTLDVELLLELEREGAARC